MASSGYYDSSKSSRTDARNVQYRRVPDNGLSPLSSTPSQPSPCRTNANDAPPSEDKYVTSTTSRDGKVETHNHRQPRYDPEEPRTKQATYEDYNRSRVESRRIEDRRSQSYR
jgi:hypothetical protein